ncbi:MAG: protein translocase subunit SecD [Clostridia bacterium]|nr:protein translocase subunit SecD [Clostridia bacterium]
MANKVKTRKKISAQGKGLITLAVFLVITVVLGVLSITGMVLPPDGLYKLLPWVPTNAANWPASISLGLDLRGGVYVEYQATRPEDTSDDMYAYLISSTMDVMRNRLTDQGYPEATVTQIDNDGIRVEIPDVTDPNAVLELIGTPALLEFKSPEGETFMTGANVKNAYPTQDTSNTTINNYYAVGFELDAEGTKLFADMTSASIGQQIAIYLDGTQIMAPTVNTAITEGSGIITGSFTQEQAQALAIQIQSGALPLTLTQQKVDTISATLGVDALQTSLTAAAIGILLVMLIMIVRYRLSGVVASWALILYIIILFWFVAMLPGFQLTLPGIAGVILGIGMAVDANVVIFERFGEELALGRQTKAAAKMGFKNAFSAILDANVTTLIAAIVLMVFGTGSVRGFANMLALSVVCSKFTAIVISRVLLSSFINVIPNKPELFSAKALKKEAQ